MWAFKQTVSLCVYSLELSEWRGQNQRTLVVGWFPASLAVPASTSSNAGPNPAAGQPFISAPLKGSLQHTGHGDIKPDHSWGAPEGADRSVVLLIHSPQSHGFSFSFLAFSVIIFVVITPVKKVKNLLFFL